MMQMEKEVELKEGDLFTADSVFVRVTRNASLSQFFSFLREVRPFCLTRSRDLKIQIPLGRVLSRGDLAAIKSSTGAGSIVR